MTDSVMTGRQKKYLRHLAHHLKPVVHVGREGVTDALLAAVVQALEDHELIKVRFQDHKDEKKALSRTLATGTEAEWVGMVGHVAILYRPRREREKRTINLADA